VGGGGGGGRGGGGDRGRGGRGGRGREGEGGGGGGGAGEGPFGLVLRNTRERFRSSGIRALARRTTSPPESTAKGKQPAPVVRYSSMSGISASQ